MLYNEWMGWLKKVFGIKGGSGIKEAQVEESWQVTPTTQGLGGTYVMEVRSKTRFFVTGNREVFLDGVFTEDALITGNLERHVLSVLDDSKAATGAKPPGIDLRRR